MKTITVKFYAAMNPPYRVEVSDPAYSRYETSWYTEADARAQAARLQTIIGGTLNINPDTIATKAEVTRHKAAFPTNPNACKTCGK